METAQTVLMPGIIPLTCTSILQWCIVVQCNHRSRELVSLFCKILFILYSYIAVELLFQYVQWELEGIK